MEKSSIHPKVMDNYDSPLLTLVGGRLIRITCIGSSRVFANTVQKKLKPANGIILFMEDCN